MATAFAFHTLLVCFAFALLHVCYVTSRHRFGFSVKLHILNYIFYVGVCLHFRFYSLIFAYK